MYQRHRTRSTATHFLSALLVSLQIITWTPSSFGLPNGAPESVCETMLPFHGGGIPAQTSAAPFEVVTSALVIGQGQTLRVDILGITEGLSFGGFMIMARTANEPFQAVGQFNPPNTNVAKLLNCDKSVNNAATHTSTNPKTAVTLEWQAPVDFLGEIVFRTTVAQTYNMFWVGVESQPVEVVTPDKVPGGANTTPLPSTPSTAFAPTTRPNYTPTPPPSSSAPIMRDAFYDNCGVSKTCFGMPDGCVNSGTCTVATAVTVRGSIYEFEVQSIAAGAAYAALGLSTDDKMGDDLVTECVPENGRVNVYTSYTSRAPYGTTRTGVPQNTVRLLEGSVNNGAIYCRVQREVVTATNNQRFDLQKNNYYLLVATGSEVKENGVGYHDLGRLASGSGINLAEVATLGGASLLLVRLHGAFMIVAWIGTTSLGIIFARYFKQTWTGSQICGKDQWFAWHRICMVTTWSLTMVAFILIFVQLGAWSAERNPHAILGLVTTILCFIQPIGALFRPAPSSKTRPIFNWLHWLAGNLAHILAIVTIFFAVQLTKAQLPSWVDWILVAYVCVHVLVHLVFSISGCSSDRVQSQRVNTFQMGDVGGHHPGMRNGQTKERRADAPHAGLRKGLLTVYGILLLVFVIVLVLTVVLAPIETYFENLSS